MKKPKRLLTALLVLLMLVSVVALSSCQSGAPAATYDKPVQLARTSIWQDINSGKACSASMAILDNGMVVYSEGFGVADRETSTPVDTGTLFNMGSVSKTFDTAALMVLVDEGKVKLDAPVTQYLTDFKMADPRYKDVTVRMLLNHSSGFPGTAYANNMGYAFNKTIYEETLANLARSNLKAAPGETAPYCNDGFTLAEMIVARVSGRDFVDFLSDKVLKPLSLTRTGVSVGQRPDDGISRFYLPDTGKLVPSEVLSVIGAGGLSSTAEELVSFMDSFSAGGQHVLSSSAIAEMTKAQPSKFATAAMKETGVDPEMTYGLGFDLTSVPSFQEKGIKVIGKGGDSDDYHAMMLSVPDKRISVAVMEAGHGSTAPAIALSVLESVLEAKGLVKAEKTSVVPPAPQAIPASYAGLAGIYAGDTSVFKVSFDFTNNVATLSAVKNGVETTVAEMTYNDGNFVTATGGIFKFISADGRDLLLTDVDGGFMTAGQRLAAIRVPAALGVNINGKQWLRRNVKPFEGISETSSHILVSGTIPELPGYVNFKGIKKIASPTFAGMATDAIRDLTELTLVDRNGQTWAQVSDTLYSPSEVAAALTIGQKDVTIGKDGYSEWLQAGQDLVVSVAKPSGARVIVLSPQGSSSYDSEIDTGEAFVPAGDFVELAGTPGTFFKVTATSP